MATLHESEQSESLLNTTLQRLRALEEEIVESLKPSDLDGLSTVAAEMGVISSDVKRSFDSLNHKVPRPRKIRYLLIHAYEGLKASPRLLGRWLEVLCRYGVPGTVLRKAVGVGTTDVGGSERDKCSQNVARFSEEHVTALVEILAGYSSKWRSIGMSLNLPRSIEKNLEAKLHMYDDVNTVCLREVLHEWIVGHHKHAKAPTLENLKRALESILVGLGKIARELNEDYLATHGICFTQPVLDLYRKQNTDSLMPSLSKRTRLDVVSQPLDTGVAKINIVSQPLNTEVAEGESILLEVGVFSTCGGTISYQWLKEGCPLKDDGEHYLGSNRSMLCITGSLTTKGTYTCQVRSFSESEQQNALFISNPALVTVNFSQCKKVLVDMYHAQSEVHRDAWPPVGNRTYINLALVKQRRPDAGDIFTYSTIQGDMNDVVHEKESIRYNKAFGEYTSEYLILIEGRPGSGKTTLVHKVSQDWAKGSILKGAKYVFLISLRVLSAKAIINLSDIMKELFYKNDDETAQSMLKKINCTNGEGVCFILDGLDEYKEQDSVVFDLIGKKYLRQSMVIVSSRPSATFAYRQKVNVYIEVIGFLKTEIQEYVLNYPFNRSSPQSLLLYLDQHPNVLHMCYLPVHVAMISFLHDKINGDLPSTECEMYKYFTNFTLYRKEGYRPPNSVVILMSICKRAFQMTVSHEQFFIDTEELSPSETNADPFLGLVTVDSTAGLYGYHHLYTFVHLTFQEYLAACYIAKLGEQEQIEVISKYGHMDHMRVVWRFYCGLVSFEGEDHKFTKILKSRYNDQLFHCQCAFESQQPVTCKSVVLHNCSSLEFSATHSADFTCLGYVISNSSNTLESLQVSYTFIGDQIAKLHALAEILKQYGQLRVLDVQSNQLGDEGAKCLGDCLKQCYNLTELNLGSNQIGDEGARSISEGLRYCSNMLQLHLHDNQICDKGAKCLGDSFMHCKTLSKLRLDSNKISDEGAKLLGDGLGHCSYLSKLLLDSNIIGDEGAKGLGGGLRKCNNLSELSLSNNNIGDEGAKGLSDDLRECSNLSLLRFTKNKIGDEGVKGLGDILRHCNKLSTLYLSLNKIGNRGAEGLGNGLRQYSNLYELYLGSNKIGDEGAKGLGVGLGRCSNLHILYLSYNNIGDEGAKGLSEGLNQCSSLSVLHLCHNNIGDEGAKGLGKGLMQCNNLSALYLSHNNIGDEGAKGLGDTIRHCSNLSEVYLDSNKIGNKGAKALKQCSKLDRLWLHCNTISRCHHST